MIHKTYFKEDKVLRKNKSFSDDTRNLFCYNYECFVCGKNNWDALHHINGGRFEEADSPLNACPINNYPCHIGQVFNEEITVSFLSKTLRYLYLNHYEFTEKDLKYICRFQNLYDKNENNKKIINLIKTKFKKKYEISNSTN
jgi:hypothetical protein